jgi:hypothetical protein
MGRSVFVSHSCNTRPDSLAMQVRNALVAALGPAGLGYDVWIDQQRIHPGDFWRNEIHDAIRGSSAGVVLLDAEALASNWVLIETTLLVHRAITNPRYVVVPVLLGLDSSSVLEKYPPWKSLGLREIQVVKSADVDDAVQQVVAEFPAVDATPDPLHGDYDKWVGRIADALTMLPRATKRLDDVCADLHLGVVDWGTDDAVDLFAHALVTAPQNAVKKVVREIAAGAPGEARRLLADHVTPVWVDLAAGVTLLQGLEAGRAVVGTNDYAVATRHVERATGCSPHLRLVEVPDVYGEDLGELTRLCVQTAYDKAAPSVRRARTPEAYAEWVRADPSLRRVLIVKAGPIRADLLKPVLDEVVRQCPGLAIVFLSGRDTSLAEGLGPPNVIVARPEPTDADEKAGADFEDELGQIAKGA